MSNKLAEDVLNKDMLFLLQCYAEENQTVKVGSVIKLLKHTSTLCDVFRDRHPITSLNDHRIEKLIEVAKFFADWEDAHQHMTKKDIRKTLITPETREDIASMIWGFIAICKHRISCGKDVKPYVVNSDPIEELFSLQRSLFNGADQNPNVHMYAANINSCLICNYTVPQKCNVFSSERDMKRKALAPIQNQKEKITKTTSDK